MYKTVRHGENSLQYTILPQTEEVLSNSGLKGKGRDYSPSIHIRRSRRKSALKYIILVVIGIVVALAFASVPLYVLNGALYARRMQHDQNELMTSAPHTPAGREIVKSRKKELLIAIEAASTLKSQTDLNVVPLSSTTSSTTTTTISTTTVSERATTPPWRMPALRSWKFSSSSTTIQPIPTEDTEQIPFVGTPSGSVRLLDHYISMSMKPWDKDVIIRPTMTPKPKTFRDIFKYYARTFTPPEKAATLIKLYDDSLITTKGSTTQTPITTELSKTTETSIMKDLKDTLLSVDDDEEFKESLEVDEVFSLPPMKPDTAAPGNDFDEVTVSKATDSGWYGARWPFVDTSSYFQWTGYSPGDNLLLPLLVAALSSIALVLLLALAVRRRKRTTIASAQMGLTADLQADDNTNLLTAENPEEVEE